MYLSKNVTPKMMAKTFLEYFVFIFEKSKYFSTNDYLRLFFSISESIIKTYQGVSVPAEFSMNHVLFGLLEQNARNSDIQEVSPILANLSKVIKIRFYFNSWTPGPLIGWKKVWRRIDSKKLKRVHSFDDF